MSSTEPPRIHVVTFHCRPFTPLPEPLRDTWAEDTAPARHVESLCEALSARGVPVSVTLPLPARVDREAAGLQLEPGAPLQVRFGRMPHQVRAWQGSLGRGRVPVRLLECDEFFRDLSPEAAPDGSAMGFFARAVLQALRTQPERRPRVISCQGAATAPLPTMLRLHHGEEPFYTSMRTALTLHDGALEEGGHDPSLLSLVGFTPDRFYSLGPFEHHGRLSFTKAALIHADLLLALSRGHARLLESSDLVRSVRTITNAPPCRFHGIRVGIDTRSWDPSSDPRLPENYSAQRPEGKARCREVLLGETGLPPARPDEPVLAFVGPLTRERGADLVIEAAGELASRGMRLVIAGSGEGDLEEAAQDLARHAHVAVRITSDRRVARGVLAGADACLLPCRQELVATRLLQALRYGAVPVACAAAGFEELLAEDAPTPGHAFLVAQPTRAALLDAALRLQAAFADPARRTALVRAALSADVGWETPAARHAELFAALG